LIPQINATELAQWRADAGRRPPVLVDVREPWEFELARIEGSLHVPLGTLPRSLDRLPRGEPLVIVCHHGSRSQNAAAFLVQSGFTDVHNLSGGVAAWAAEVDPTMKTY
jgi:rhodanese-related sulfurtransferase